MPSYSNGYIPTDLLVTFHRGYNSIDGHWNHSLSPATYSRHLALVARAQARTGRTLAISEGWCAYRPYAPQVTAREIYGSGAAWPGTSSHGGFWENRQTLAMDYGNWSWVYQNHGGWSAFVEDCASVGLWAGAIMPERGYPREQWHVVDLDPWSAAPAFDSSSPFTVPIIIPEGDEYMRFLYTQDSGGSLWTLLNTATGKKVQDRTQAVADSWATAWGSAKVVSVQDFLNALHAVELTADPSPAILAELVAAIGELTRQVEAGEVDPVVVPVEPGVGAPPKA